MYDIEKGNYFITLLLPDELVQRWICVLVILTAHLDTHLLNLSLNHSYLVTNILLSSFPSLFLHEEKKS